jgi:hypothetical protein
MSTDKPLPFRGGVWGGAVPQTPRPPEEPHPPEGEKVAVIEIQYMG